MDNILLYTKLSALPDRLKLEVEDFIDFLIHRAKKSQHQGKPIFGSGNGVFIMKADFDESLADFKE
ncbi:MAG: DUF2281 domain-containing protein [Chitinophagaceae bacterium]